MIPLLVVSNVTWATPLWVAPEQVEAARAVVEELWPAGPLAVEPRPPELIGEALMWDGTQLVLIRDGRAWVGPAPDLETAVLLARTWLRDAEPEVGWVPVIAPPPGVETPVEAPPPPPALDRRLHVRGTLGARQRLGSAGPVSGPAVGLGLASGPFEVWASVFVAFGEERVTDLDLLRVAIEDLDTFVERGSGTLVGTWNFGLPRQVRGRVTVAPLLVAGVEVRAATLRRLSSREVTRWGGLRFGLGSALGAGGELWLGNTLAARFTVIDRSWNLLPVGPHRSAALELVVSR